MTKTYRPPKATSGRWLPTASVVVLSAEAVNGRGAEKKGRKGVGMQQPGIVDKAPNGDLLVMTTLAEPQQVVLLRSGDGGRTWSKPGFVYLNKSYDHIEYLGTMKVLRSGRILGIMNGEYPGWPKDYRTPTFAVYSDDGGRNWKVGPPIQVPGFYSTITQSPLIEHENGTLLTEVWGHVETDLTRSGGGLFACGLMRSVDGGLTWDEATVICRGEPAIGTMPNEGSVLPLPSGKWLAMFRMNWGEPSRYPNLAVMRSESQDQGRTWSQPRLVLGQTGWPWLRQLPDGGVMLSGSGAFGVRYLVSYDEGRSWSYEQVLESCGDTYTSSVQLDDNTLFLLHGSGMGMPHHPAYWFAGLRGWWIRKT